MAETRKQERIRLKRELLKKYKPEDLVKDSKGYWRPRVEVKRAKG
jgi:hypothetical protein